MSKITTTIKAIIDSGYKLFDFPYPIFDENYRAVLEGKIIRRYYFREIGFETVGLFKYYLETRLNEIMPYYNEQYLISMNYKQYDPYKNKDVTTEDTRTVKSDSSASSNSDGKTIFNDTPTSKLGDADYSTTITDNTDAATNTGTVTTTEEFVTHTHGHDGMRYPTDILKDVRESVINIDVMILEELSDLFMLVY